MTEHEDDGFEDRLRQLLAKTRKFSIPPVSQNELAEFRKLIPKSLSPVPELSLIWRRAADGVAQILDLTGAYDLELVSTPSPVFRDGDNDKPQLDAVVISVDGGELRAQMTQGENQRVKVALSVRGKLAERDDLSVELTQGQRLLEARPLEQKAEVTLNGIGAFNLTLFTGNEALGSMQLNIDVAEEPDHA